MAGRGARYFALLSRSGVVQESDSASAADWAELVAIEGVDARPMACDVADASALDTACTTLSMGGSAAACAAGSLLVANYTAIRTDHLDGLHGKTYRASSLL